MDFSIILVIILSILPISELRGGIPLGISYAIREGISPLPIIMLSIFSNILVIFLAFYFLDRLHKIFLKNKLYNKLFDSYIQKVQKKISKFQNQYAILGFLALAIFVAIPLPGTGAWTGVLISWMLSLDRKRSIISIACGVILAGIIVSLGTLGIISVFF